MDAKGYAKLIQDEGVYAVISEVSGTKEIADKLEASLRDVHAKMRSAGRPIAVPTPPKNG
jgi:hypothetical protein